MADLGINSKEIKEQAKAEVLKERREEAIERFKELYNKLERARKVVKNIEREIEDLELELEINN